MAYVDVFVGNHTVIDPDMYDLWLAGYTAHDAAVILQRRGVLQKYEATFDDLVSDTLDHYRTFGTLERLLKSPPRLLDQQIYQIDVNTQKMLIEKYYSFDAPVVRELLGKKLSSRNRKDLDDVSDKSRVALRSCRRQFDNVKRVFKTVEDLMGSLVENIKMHYLLSENLARQYAAIVFITNNRFETGKKKLNYLKLSDFLHCADQMIQNWSYSAIECDHHEDMDVDLDRDFLQKLRDLKVLAEKDLMDEHKSLVLPNVRSSMSDKIYQDLEVNFKNISKTLINIAYGLNHSKDARDIFIDLSEKLIDPWLQMRWIKNDVKIFLTAYKETCHCMQFFTKGDPNLLTVWERYMNTVTSCILKMYHS